MGLAYGVNEGSRTLTISFVHMLLLQCEGAVEHSMRHDLMHSLPSSRSTQPSDAVQTSSQTGLRPS
jgi:hypothetical protein